MHRRTLLRWQQLVLLGALTWMTVAKVAAWLLLDLVTMPILRGTLLPSVAMFLTSTTLDLPSFRDLVEVFLGNRSGSMFTLTRPDWRTCLQDLVTIV